MVMHVCYKVQCAHSSNTGFITDLDIAAMKFAQGNQNVSLYNATVQDTDLGPVARRMDSAIHWMVIFLSCLKNAFKCNKTKYA